MIDTVLLVAVAENGVIGRDNTIPWRLKADQQRLKAMTMGKPVVMGRKTFVSLRRPLPARTNIVITRDAQLQASSAVVTTSFATACDIAKADARRRGVGEIAVIGGVEIYNLVLPTADRLEITEVHAAPDGDTHFPAIDLWVWQETARERHAATADDSADYSDVTYRRHPR